MTHLAIGFSCLALTIILIVVGFPVGLAMGAVAFIGLQLIIGTVGTLSMIKNLPFEVAASWELSAVPMFLLMGTIAFRAGMTTSLFDAARLWLGRLPGGLAVATNFACAGFAAASGSSLATTVAMGRIAVPEMLRYRYDPGLATGLIASAGTLGSMIPPSILMVLYGIFAEVSISSLFMAGILPGLLTAVIYAVMIISRCSIDPSLGPPQEGRPTKEEKWKALLEVWPLPLLVLGVIGSIYGGIATPTEAGALGVSLSLAIAWMRRQLSWQVLLESLREALHSTAAIFFVTIGAFLMIRLIAMSGISPFLGEVMRGSAVSPVMLVLTTAALYLVLGCLLDPIGMVLLTLPVLLPMWKAAGLDLVWLGILVVKFVEIGLITPPVGMNIFAVRALNPGIPTTTIFKGAAWFLACELVVLALLISFPRISLLLPSMMN